MNSASFDTFNKETKELFIERCILLYWLGIFLFPLFSILDFLVTQNNFFHFLAWRIFFILLLSFSLIWTKKTYNYRVALVLFLSTYTTGIAIIAMMGLVMEEQNLIYYGASS